MFFVLGKMSEFRLMCRELFRMLQRDEETIDDIYIHLSRVARHNRRAQATIR